MKKVNDEPASTVKDTDGFDSGDAAAQEQQRNPRES
jgi:hypothetical protein